MTAEALPRQAAVEAGRRAERGSRYRDLAAGVISLAIVGLTLWMMAVTFIAAGGAGEATITPFERQKDVLQLGLGLLGAVLGYYFGRIPAERRAEQAESVGAVAFESEQRAIDVLRTAQDARELAERRLEDARSTVARVRAGLRGEAGEGPVTIQGSTPPELLRALTELDALAARL